MSTNVRPSRSLSTLSRRDFLRLAGAGTAGLLMSSCRPQAQEIALEEMSVTYPRYPVSAGRVHSYDRESISKKVADLIAGLGGLSSVVKPGDSVAIKTNLTGGVTSGRLPGITPVESFITHPEVVRALVDQVKSAGAGDIFIVEAVYEWDSFVDWGYEDVAEDTGAMLIDLNDTKPYDEFTQKQVGSGSFIYENFTFNRILNEVDVFMSVAKMKNHYHAGVTHSMKNLIGLVPYRFYRMRNGDSYRSEFHGRETETQARLPRVIVDLNRARPIDFSLIDGVKTTQGGEGPWIDSMSAIEPGLLVAGVNSVAADAVATALMGHDPAGECPDSPYLRCDNHLNIAAAMGLGPNRLEEIELLGLPLEEGITQFAAA